MLNNTYNGIVIPTEFRTSLVGVIPFHFICISIKPASLILSVKKNVFFSNDASNGIRNLKIRDIVISIYIHKIRFLPLKS